MVIDLKDLRESFLRAGYNFDDLKVEPYIDQTGKNYIYGLVEGCWNNNIVGAEEVQENIMNIIEDDITTNLTEESLVADQVKN